MPHPRDYEWYNDKWPLEFTGHVRQRMDARQIDEAALRQAWGNARDVRMTRQRNRFAVSGRQAGRLIEVVVQPDPVRRTVVVVTVYEQGAT